MAKIKKRITTEMMGDEEEERPKDEQDDAEDTAMEKAVMDFADGERMVKLYRYPGDLGGRPRFLGGLSQGDFNEVFIQERFGGGKYFGRWRKKNGQYTRFSFDIEGDAKVFTRAEEARRSEEEEGEEPYPYLHRNQQDQGSDKINMVDVLKMMAETRKESREEMRMMLDLMRPQQTAPDATEKVFSLVEKLAPLISAGGEGGNSNPWLFALSQLKDPLLKIVDTIQVAVTRGPVQPVQPVQPSPVHHGPPIGGPILPNVHRGAVPVTPEPTPEPQPSLTIEPPTEGNMIAESFKEYLPMFVKAASQGKDPGLYCDLILDQVPVFGYDRLRKWLLTSGCLDDLAKLAPVIAADPAQRHWWSALRQLLFDAINEELGDATRNLQPESDSIPPATSSADSPVIS